MDSPKQLFKHQFMVKDIREHTKFTQEDMAGYLNLSVETIRSIELGRRQLPLKRSVPAIMMLATIHKCKEAGPINDAASAADYQIRLVKRMLRRCRHRLSEYTFRLKEMQQEHAAACFNVGLCQRLLEMLPIQTEDDLTRVKWTQNKLEEIQARMKFNNPAAQIVLMARIDGLRSMVQTLETFPELTP